MESITDISTDVKAASARQDDELDRLRLIDRLRLVQRKLAVAKQSYAFVARLGNGIATENMASEVRRISLEATDLELLIIRDASGVPGDAIASRIVDIDHQDEWSGAYESTSADGSPTLECVVPARRAR